MTMIFTVELLKEVYYGSVYRDTLLNVQLAFTR